jgi:hypothetical protein
VSATDPIKAAREAALSEYRQLLTIDEPTAAQSKKLFGLMGQLDFTAADVTKHRQIVRRVADLERRAAMPRDEESAVVAINALSVYDEETAAIVKARDAGRRPLAAATEEARRKCTDPLVAANQLGILKEQTPDLWPPEPLGYRPAHTLPEPKVPWEGYEPAPYRPNTQYLVG